MLGIKIISDNNKRSTKIKTILNSQVKKNNYYNLNIIVVIGGDGFMLQTLKKNKSLKKFFYGINSGNYGFLMNKFSSKNMIKNLSKAKMITNLDFNKFLYNNLLENLFIKNP